MWCARVIIIIVLVIIKSIIFVGVQWRRFTGRPCSLTYYKVPYFFGCLLHLVPYSLKSRLVHIYYFFKDCFFLCAFIVEQSVELCRHFFLDLLTHLLRLYFLGSLVNTLIQPLHHFSRVITVWRKMNVEHITSSWVPQHWIHTRDPCCLDLLQPKDRVQKVEGPALFQLWKVGSFCTLPTYSYTPPASHKS